MRPIDADILKSCISQQAEVVEESEDDILAVATLKVIVKCFLGIIDKTPTIPPIFMREKYDCNHDCDALYEAYQKGREDALKKEIKR